MDQHLFQNDPRVYRYFMMMRDGHIPCQQDGVFRSNCMDCLDRTNVVQGLFAKVTLEEQLQVRNSFTLQITMWT